MTALHPSGRCNTGDHGACSFGDMCPCYCHAHTLLPRPTLEKLEADCRVLMSEVVACKVRGFDSARLKAQKMRELDHALDLYNLAASAWREDELCPSP